MRKDVSSTQLKSRIEVFNLVPASLPTGTAAQSTAGCTEGTFRCTVLKNGDGDYTINFNEPFSRAPVVHPTCLSTTLTLIPVVHSKSTTAVRILVWDETATAANPTSLGVTVIGFDSVDQVG